MIAVVEDTDLPRQLKDKVYETLEDRGGATVEDADGADERLLVISSGQMSAAIGHGGRTVKRYE